MIQSEILRIFKYLNLYLKPNQDIGANGLSLLVLAQMVIEQLAVTHALMTKQSCLELLQQMRLYILLLPLSLKMEL